MNRRAVILATAVAAVGIFAIGGLVYSPTTKDASTTNLTSNNTPLVRPHAPVFGPLDAPVTIVEFFDPACEACRAFHPIVKQIISAFPGKVRVVLRYAAFHQPSEEAIRILEAARLQGKFEAVLEQLFKTQPRWAPHGRPADDVWTVILGTGLDVGRAKNDAMMPDIGGVLNQDSADVKAAGVTRTPTFFVNGKPLQEFGAQQLYDMVKVEVEAL